MSENTFTNIGKQQGQTKYQRQKSLSGRSKYSNEFEIYARIISALPCIKTRIMFKSCVSSLQLNRKLRYLLDTGLVIHQAGMYYATDKGMKFSYLVNEIIDMLKGDKINND